MATIVGQIALELGVDTKQFKNQLRDMAKQTKNSTNSMTQMFGKVGKVIGAAFAVKKIADFAKSCINLGSDLAEVQNVVDVTFGSMSAKVNDFAKNAMDSYGLSEKVAKQYMGTFGAMSKSFGNTTEAAYEQAAALTGLAGDVASFYNLTTDEAYTKLKSVFTGETESLKELGVVMTQTALDEYALQKGMGKTTSQMSEQEKVALRLAFVTDRLSAASGDFSRTAGGWANQTRVLALRFDALKATIGQGLINVLLPIVRVLNDIIAGLQVAADAFKDFTEAVFGKGGSSGVSSAVSSAAASSGALSSNMGDTAESAAAIKKSLAGFDSLNILSSGSGSSGGGAGSSSGSAAPDITESITPEVNSRAEKIKGFLNDVKTKLLEIADMTGLAGLWDNFLISVGNVKTGVLNLFESFKGAVAMVAPIFEKFKTSISNTFLTVTGTITEILGDFWLAITEGFASFTAEYGPEIKTALASVMAIILNLYTLISDVFGGLFASLRDWWNKDGKRILNEVIEIAKTLGGWILKIWNEWIAPVIINVQKILAELWKNHLQPLWDEILALVTSVGNLVIALWEKKLKPHIDWLVNVLGPVLVPIINALASLIGKTIGQAVDHAKKMISALRGIIDFLTGIFTTDWKKVWTNIKNYFAGVGTWFSDKIASIKKFFSGLWSSIKDGASSAWSKIKSVFTGIGSWFGDKATAVKDKFSSMWSKLKSGASSAWTGIKDTFSKVPTWFKDKFTDAWTKVKNVFSSGGKIFDGIKDGISDAFKKIVNKLIDGINTIVAKPFNKINELLTKIRNTSILGAKPFSWLGSISVPQIPKLATGGYVAANTPQLAIIGDNKHEGEIVAPESKIAEAVAVGVASAMRQIVELLNARNSNNSQSPLVIKIGERDVWQGFVDYHNSTVKRTGNSPLLI